MSHVFISYSHADADFAELVQSRLEKDGIEVWIDEQRLRAGEDWREEIDQALLNAFALILIMSPDSMQSPYVMYEWSYAWGTGKKVIPLLYKNIENEQIHPRLDKRQYLDFIQRAARPWNELVDRLSEVQNNPHIRLNKDVNQEPHIEPQISRLVNELHSTNRNARLIAIRMLKQIGPIQSLVEDITHALRTDPEWEVRVVAAQMLGELKNRASILDLLIVLKSDTNPDVRGYAAEALGEIGDKSVVPTLIECLDDDKRGERGRVDEFVVEALKKIGTPEALEAAQNWFPF